MKIGVTCYPTAGGSGVIATELGVAMAARGHEVHFISYASPLRLREYRENVFYHNVEVSAYPLFKYPPYDIALASRMAEVIQSEHLDILHVHYAIPHAICAYLAKHMVPEFGTKVITTLHGTDITLVGTERSYFPTTRFAIERSDGVTAVSNYLQQETLKIFEVDTDIQVIYNFVDTEVFKHDRCPDVRKQFAEADEKLVMHVSNMRPVKRVCDVIEVFEKIQREIPARLLMIGEGPDRRKAEELVRDLGITDYVSFLGNQEGIPDLLCAADLFLLPSEFETFGLAALEAMACETPVLMTRIGGTTELLHEGEGGYLFDVGDVDAMAQKGLYILADPARIASYGKVARKRVLESFSKDVIVDKYEAYYERVLKN